MKIDFKYSAPLDRFRAGEDHAIIGNESAKRIRDRLNKAWLKESKKVHSAIYNVTRIPWRIKQKDCYLVAGRASVSEPLILAWSDNVQKAIDTLTHELIHINLSQRKVSSGWKKLMIKYKDEPRLTRVHIVIHAIHEQVALKLHNKKYLTNLIKRTKHPLYVRAWEIVQRDGAEKILKELLQK